MSEQTTGQREVGVYEQRNVERLALENPRSLEFLEFINTSSRHTVLRDVAQLGRPFFRVEPGFAAVHLAHAGQNDYLPVFVSLGILFLRGNK